MNVPGTSRGTGSEFDAYAHDYREALQDGLRYSGEDGSYFARGRVDWLGRRLRELGPPSRAVLDFGCGAGLATPFLLGLAGVERVVGVDVSAALLQTARREHGSERVRFVAPHEAEESAFDIVYCNGVFHHIPPPERPDALGEVRRMLRPGGLFALWENNPWNPGARLVMRRISFDRDAIPLSAPEARRLLRAGGFAPVTTDFLFIFPRQLRRLRRTEQHLVRLPLGAQYMVLAHKA